MLDTSVISQNIGKHDAVRLKREYSLNKNNNTQRKFAYAWEEWWDRK